MTARVARRSSVPVPIPIKQRQLSLALPTEQDMVQLPDMTDWERMVADYGLLGLSPSYHPLALLRRDLPADVLTAEQVRAGRKTQPADVAGVRRNFGSTRTT